MPIDDRFASMTGGVQKVWSGMLLDRDMLIDGLTELGMRSAAAGKIIELAVYGGSCLRLVSNFRDASQDVEAVARATSR